MSLSTRDLWFITPLQAFAVIGNSIVCGASGLQSPLAMPMLQLEKVPPHVAGTQLLWLLHESEFIFPPINAVCMLTNLASGITSYFYRDSNAAANAKYPYALAAFGLNAAVTAYTLTFMVPKNNRAKNAARTLQTNHHDEKSAKELHQILDTWKRWNIGRALLMLAATVVGTIGLLEDGAAAKIPRI